MGTINYRTSDYITMGIKPYETDDYKNDSDFINFIREEWGIDTDNETEVYNAIREQIDFDYEQDIENVKSILDKYNFWFYHVAIKPGYYEGFSLDIENNFPIAYDSYEDKKAAQREITQLKQFLIDCAGIGLVCCFPGWCTTYFDYNETINRIKAAIKEIREESRNITTWTAAERKGIEL